MQAFLRLSRLTLPPVIRNDWLDAFRTKCVCLAFMQLKMLKGLVAAAGTLRSYVFTGLKNADFAASRFPRDGFTLRFLSIRATGTLIR